MSSFSFFPKNHFPFLLFFFLYPRLLQDPVPHLLSLFLPFCLSVIPLLYKCHLLQIVSLFHKQPLFLTFIQINYFLYLTIICMSTIILSKFIPDFKSVTSNVYLPVTLTMIFISHDAKKDCALEFPMEQKGATLKKGSPMKKVFPYLIMLSFCFSAYPLLQRR